MKQSSTDAPRQQPAPAPLSTHPLFRDLTGKRFGRLRVEYYIGHVGAMNGWFCRCRCGGWTVAISQTLTRGHSQSCGCRKRERTAKLASTYSFKHGMARRAEYQSWNSAMYRCFHPKCRAYPRYGARGIVVCLRWRQSFAAFFEDMGRRPSRRMTLDRRDNDGNYSCGKCEECHVNGWPANCRWATWHEQALNKSNNRLITFRGETQPMGVWAQEIGMHPAVLQGRLDLGFTPEEALTLPRGARRQPRSRGYKKRHYG